MSPIVIVGQPRSGSTLLTRIVNEANEAFILNDFYVLQKIDAAGLWGVLDAQSAAQIATWVFERIEIRATQESGKTLEQSIDLSTDGLEATRAVAAGPWADGLMWSDVLETVMMAAAKGAGRSRWGWNTPQDHFFFDKIFAAYPQARAAVLLRNPPAVLSSYKNVSGPWHEPRRYNPYAIGMAWRAACNSYDRWHAQEPDRVIFLRYEDLVENTQDSTARLAAHFDLSFGAFDIADFGRNTSHGGGQKQPVSPSELALCYRAIGPALADHGFAAAPEARWRLADMAEILRIGARSVGYLVGSVLTDADRRKRVFKLLGAR